MGRATSGRDPPSVHQPGVQRLRRTGSQEFIRADPFIGIISATRGSLAVGARLSVTDFSQLHGAEFTSSMIELGVNAGVIIALGVALRLIGNFLDDDSSVTRRDAAKTTSDASGDH
ncbi:MAG TPA: hypothetical protein VMV29_05195 [Ktedonobacterales bacterium]|nr:hypothetical protein [Ktedonobacterales bacterium]